MAHMGRRNGPNCFTLWAPPVFHCLWVWSKFWGTQLWLIPNMDIATGNKHNQHICKLSQIPHVCLVKSLHIFQIPTHFLSLFLGQILSIPDFFCVKSQNWLVVFFPLIWVWVNTYRYIFSGMNIHKSQLWLGVHQGYQGFDPSPDFKDQHDFFVNEKKHLLLDFSKQLCYIYDVIPLIFPPFFSFSHPMFRWSARHVSFRAERGLPGSTILVASSCLKRCVFAAYTIWLCQNSHGKWPIYRWFSH